MSEPLSNSDLYKAIAAFQAEIGVIQNDAVNSAFGKGKQGIANYASLAGIIETIRRPLAKNGLCQMQFVSSGELTVTVLTRVAHTSGQFIESSITVPVAGNNAGSMGSAITYGRRYGLCALLGIANGESEDDGESAGVGPGGARSVELDPQILSQVNECSTVENLNSLFKTLSDRARASHKPLFTARKELLEAKTNAA